jgi:hypothetical protein
LSVLHQNLLHGKLPRNLHWTDALELVGHLGQVQPGAGVEFTFIVGTHREIFKRPHSAELGIDDVSRLRRFLKEAASEASVAERTDGADSTNGTDDTKSTTVADPHRMAVVIDHHAAHIFQDAGGSRPREEVTIEPYDPHHFHHHLVHRKESHYQGGRVPEETSFYAEIAEALAPAQEIVLIGHGTGKSSALDFLVDYLKKHRPDVSARVVATETADLSALTEPEAEALAKRHLLPLH